MNGESPFHQPEPVPTPPKNGANKKAVDPALRVAIGLAYLIGWLVALVGIRLFHNLVLLLSMAVW